MSKETFQEIEKQLDEMTPEDRHKLRQDIADIIEWNRIRAKEVRAMMMAPMGCVCPKCGRGH